MGARLSRLPSGALRRLEITSDDYKNRSRLFIPKTRTAVRKDNAAVMASLFGSIDAVNCMPGNEGDAEQRASAAVMQELAELPHRPRRRESLDPVVSCRDGRAADRAVHRHLPVQAVVEAGAEKAHRHREFDRRRRRQERARRLEAHIDRPNCELFPPENFVIDPAADWTNPCAGRRLPDHQVPDADRRDPRQAARPAPPVEEAPESVLRPPARARKMEAEAIRRAREQGIDRFDKAQTTNHFDVIWVWETYMSHRRRGLDLHVDRRASTC
jgi:hypothetical protein